MEKIFAKRFCAAFSLVELLISLIIISLVIAAFAPIMTKRMLSSKVINASGGMNDDLDVNKDATNRDSALLVFGNSEKDGLFDCSEIDSTKTECSFKVPDKVKSLSAILVAGGGGGAGAVDSKEDETVFVGGSGLEKVITSGFEEMSGAQVLLIGSGGGGGISVSEETEDTKKLPAQCSSYGTVLLKPATYGAVRPLCFMTSNATNGYYFNLSNLEIQDLVASSRDYAGSRCTQSACCWRRSSNSVCTYDAAVKLCRNFAPANGSTKGQWKLLSEHQILDGLFSTNPNDNINFEYNCDDSYKKAKFCSVDGKYNTACPSVIGECWGAYSTHGFCDPSYYWLSGTRYAQLAPRGGGSSSGPAKGAYSVRCALLLKYYFNSYGGGAGGAGVAIVVSIPDDILHQAGKITLKSAKGGLAQNDGEPSEIVIYDRIQPSKKIWGYRAHGGKKGKDAVLGEAGAPSGEQNLCDFVQDNAWVLNRPCSEIPDAIVSLGSQGFGGEEIISKEGAAALNIAAQPGRRYDSLIGSNYAQYGAGGAGGQLGIRGDSLNPPPGANGLARLSYKRLYKGAPGGGGGGSCVAKLENTNVVPGEILKVIVGNGGKGGKNNSDGEDGYYTRLENSSKTLSYTVVAGSGGNQGTRAVRFDSDSIPGLGGKGGVCISKGTNKLNGASLRFLRSGIPGADGYFDSKNFNGYIGGFGGAPGFVGILGYPYLIGGCGGLEYGNNCFAKSIDGLSAPIIDPKDYPFPGEDYGLYGAGGGGGGLKLAPLTSGFGGDGSSGYVYFYWVKPKEEDTN